jgi:thioesterase domain-containing protein
MEIFGEALVHAQSHVIPLRTAGAGLPLFCFPGSGGNVHIFREMIAALPEGQPVYGIDMEWLCDAKDGFTVEQIAAFYLETIRSVQRNGPYHLCGYSFGGLVAYEMAKRLTDEDGGAHLVALLDAPNPALMSNLSADQSARFRRKYLSDRLGKYARDVFRGDIGAFARRGFAFFVSRVGRPFVPIVKWGFRLLNKPLPAAIRSNDPGFLRAWRAYNPSPYSGAIVCFRVEERGPEHDHDPTMGWNACAAGCVQVHVVPGGHVDMMRMPSVGMIAETLAHHLSDDRRKNSTGI